MDGPLTTRWLPVASAAFMTVLGAAIALRAFATTGIDLHNRHAEIGLVLRPACRGRHLGTDAVHVLCHYGFALRGLHRLQMTTLADNHAMIRAGLKAGFALEGTARDTAWINGAFADGVTLSQLSGEWSPAGRSTGP